MATDTKKRLEEEFTKAQQAKTAEDVNNQDTATRLWQSLKTTYGNQMEESDKAYDKAISQQDNAMMAKGMGRSSYSGQIRANMLNDKATARNKLGESLIADYQNRIGQLEEAEAARNFQREERIAGQDFQAGQAALNREHESSESAKNRQFQTDLQRMNQDWQGTQNALDRATQERLQRLSQDWQAEQNTQNQRWQSGENALNRESQARLQESSQNFQMALQKSQNYFNAEESAKDRAQNQSQFEAQLAETHQQNTIQNQQWQQSFNAQREQNTIANQQWEQQFIADQNYKSQQLAQWREQFDYDKLSNLQKVSMEKVMAIIQNGNDPDDTLLGQAGMTRAEANGMKAQVHASGGNYNPGGNDDGGDDDRKGLENDLEGTGSLNIWEGLNKTIKRRTTTSDRSLG